LTTLPVCTVTVVYIYIYIVAMYARVH